MLNNEEIRVKAYNKIKQYVNLDDEKFNASAVSFKVTDNFNLAIWCDIDYEKNNERYFIVSIRYNPHDELFGYDISNLEYSTADTSEKELGEAIDILLDSIKEKSVIKNSYGGYDLIKL